MKISVDDVKISRRVRKETGSLEGLKRSLQRFGQLQPIVINEKKELIAGFRRLSAARELGWSEIEAAEVHDPGRLDRLMIEMDENMMRKDLTANEVNAGNAQIRILSTRNPLLRWLRLMWYYLVEWFNKIAGRAL